MASTPPPPLRIHTPPTPLHGPRFDSWEPYSPQRLTRTAAKRAQLPPPPVTTPVKGHKRQRSTNLTATPAQRKKNVTLHVPSYALSPPSSPETSSARKESQSSQPPQSETINGESADINDTVAFLPTPRKTPRKQDTTARVLHFRAPSDGILATPRKRRQRLTLDSPQDTPEDVHVYTDSQDRVPEMENSDDNPFVGPRRKFRSSSVGHTPRRRQTCEEIAMDEAAKNDEGLIYTFRGRKMFRPYADTIPTTEADSTSQTARIKRMAGPAAHRPITRSKLQPRLLFTDADQPAAPDADEEADTDIEDPTPSNSQQQPEDAEPPTPRPKRTRQSPFDTWPRQKAGRAAQGVKRGAEGQSEAGAKRARSGVSAS